MPAHSPFKSLRDVVAQAKAIPASVTYAHAGIGGATHVGMEQFAQAAGVKFNAIAYKGGAPALQDVLGGQVDVLADTQFVGAARGAAASCACWPPGARQRTPRFKDTPTLKELGFDVVVEAPNGIGAPKGLPPQSRSGCAMRSARPSASDEFRKVADSIDAPVMYQDGPEYQKYVQTVYRQETDLIRKLNLKELMEKG